MNTTRKYLFNLQIIVRTVFDIFHHKKRVVFSRENSVSEETIICDDSSENNSLYETEDLKEYFTDIYPDKPTNNYKLKGCLKNNNSYSKWNNIVGINPLPRNVSFYKD